ncbi:MAG: hypothetical protein K6G23_04225 [Lachnospiraceae bacterium]|nr:hypothetical protein [Lachnospiraceae bacterium]
MILSISLLTGCGSAIPEMSEGEMGVVTQYAADFLLDTNEDASRLVDTEEVTAQVRAEAIHKAEVAAKIKANQEARERAGEEEEETDEDVPVNDAKVVNGDGSQAQEIRYEASDLSSILGLNGIDVSYIGAEMSDRYADETEEEFAPEITATSGTTLLITRFQLTNMTEAEVDADVFSTNATFRLRANESTGGSTLLTMLLSDLSTMEKIFAPGESAEYVLISQIDAATAQIDTLTLTVSCNGETYTVQLQ